MAASSRKKICLWQRRLWQQVSKSKEGFGCCQRQYWYDLNMFLSDPFLEEFNFCKNQLEDVTESLAKANFKRFSTSMSNRYCTSRGQPLALFELQQQLQHSHATPHITVAHHAYLGQQLVLDIDPFSLSNFLQTTDYSILLQLVKVDNNCLSPQFFEPPHERIVADEDHRPVYFRFPLFLLHSRQIFFIDQHLWFWFALSLRFLCLDLLGVLRYDSRFNILQYLFDPIGVAVQGSVYFVDDHTNRLLLPTYCLIRDQVINFSDQRFARPIIRSIDFFIVIATMPCYHSSQGSFPTAWRACQQDEFFVVEVLEDEIRSIGVVTSFEKSTRRLYFIHLLMKDDFIPRFQPGQHIPIYQLVAQQVDEPLRLVLTHPRRIPYYRLLRNRYLVLLLLLYHIEVTEIFELGLVFDRLRGVKQRFDVVVHGHRLGLRLVRV